MSAVILPVNTPSDPSTIQIIIRTLQNQQYTIDLNVCCTIHKLKELIAHKYGVPVVTQQLFYEGIELKDKRSLYSYKINTNSTLNQPLLLTQKFQIDIFISKKVLSLHSLIVNNRDKLQSANTVHCCSTTTVNSILKQINIFHLTKMNLLKICIGGTGEEEIVDFNKRIMDVPALMSEGILSIILCDQWFLNRSIKIAEISTTMVQTVQKITNSCKLLLNVTSFNRLQYQFNKINNYKFDKFIEIDNMLIEQRHQVYKATKWINKIVNCNGDDDDIKDNLSQKILNQLQIKIADISKTLRHVNKRWNKKSKQIDLYIRKYTKKCEKELISSYQLWLYMDIIQYLQYKDKRIKFNNNLINKFKISNLNGYNISQINDLSLKLMGINSSLIRELIILYIDKLLINDDSKTDNNTMTTVSSPVCCICVTNECNTVIINCGHMVYCNECSKKSINHSNRCPICRQNITAIIPVYKSGLHFSES